VQELAQYRISETNRNRILAKMLQSNEAKVVSVWEQPKPELGEVGTHKGEWASNGVSDPGEILWFEYVP
jgi:hypothetical protein